MDKEAGREENVPTGGALKGALNQESSLPVHPSGRQAVPSGHPSVSEESSPNPSGRQAVPSGRQSVQPENLQPPTNPSGRQAVPSGCPSVSANISESPCNLSGRQDISSERLGPDQKRNSTRDELVQVSKPSSISVFNHEDGTPLGNEFGQLSLDHEFDKRDYNKRKSKNVTFDKDDGKLKSAQASSNDIPRRCNLSTPPLNVTTHQVPLPFPQAQRNEELQKKNNKYRKEFIELFKKVNINIPHLDAIKQFPPYAKFLKELCTNKRKFLKDEHIILSEDVSAVLQGNLPPKLKDLGSFTVPCIIGNKGFDKAMLDLGASINIMPYDVYKTLALDEIKPVKISLKLADQSQVVSKGIVEDVLVKIGELLIPADFVILDMKDIVSGGEEEMPVRPRKY